jgi:hypothetical protein
MTIPTLAQTPSLWRVAGWAIALLGGAVQAAEDQIHRVGKFQVRYQTQGEHAIAGGDRNLDGVPDQVEDVLTQVMAAHRLFVEVLGFPDPFETERFRSATVLNIDLRSRDSIKGNGLAYDEVQHSKKGDWIGMKVGTHLDVKTNQTPAHELFHLIHYSTSYFKNRWFAEGTARWSERALGEGGLGITKQLEHWPLSAEQAEAVFQMSYNAAENFWNPLAARLDPVGEIPKTPALERLQAIRYSDGSPVLQDLKLSGWKFIREVIVNLGGADDLAFRDLGYDSWSENHQFSSQNNPFIWAVVEDVVRRFERSAPHASKGELGESDSPSTPGIDPHG